MKPARLLFDEPANADERRAAPGRGVWRGVALVVTIFLVTRLVVWTAAYAGAFVNFRITFSIKPPFEKRFHALHEKVTDPSTEEYWELRKRMDDLGPLTVFDGQHYRSIIDGGYEYHTVTMADPADERQQNIAFFPLFPMLCKPLTALMSSNKAMVVVAHMASLLAGLLAYFWVRRRIDEPAALFTVAGVFTLPSACYFSFGYAESTTLLFTVLTLFLAERGRFMMAAMACGLATATRPTALGLVPVLMLTYWLNKSAPRGRRLAGLVPLTLLAAAGIAAYAGYLAYCYGSPLVYLDNFRMGWVPDSQRSDWFQYLTLARVWDQFKYFGRAFDPSQFPKGLPWLLHPFTWNMPMNLFILFLSLAGLPRVPRSFRPLMLLGPFIFLHSYVASGGANFGVEPIGRYMAVATPAMVVLAAWCTREWRPAPRHFLLAAMLFLQGAWAFNFGLNEWSG